MKAIKETVEAKTLIWIGRGARGAYLGQHTHGFHVKGNCLKLDEKLVIPMPLRWSTAFKVSSMDAETCLTQHGMCGFRMYTGIWLPPQVNV